MRVEHVESRELLQECSCMRETRRVESAIHTYRRWVWYFSTNKLIRNLSALRRNTDGTKRLQSAADKEPISSTIQPTGVWDDLGWPLQRTPGHFVKLNKYEVLHIQRVLKTQVLSSLLSGVDLLLPCGALIWNSFSSSLLSIPWASMQHHVRVICVWKCWLKKVSVIFKPIQDSMWQFST